ncbi:hypothetical protein AAK964_12220 [Tissierella praeacuta]|uniref:hypothetical protein n=1 Tax=Tissierella praeacuta TaxID=43131 RepID=UPI003512B738
MKRIICKKNDEGKHYGEVECVVCKKQYNWIEDENADVVLEYITIDGYEEFYDLKVTAKCPHCNYKYPYLNSLKIK